MPTTIGRPDRSPTFLDHWAQAHGEAERRRVYGEPEEPEPEPEPVYVEPEERRRPTPDDLRAVMADAMGVSPDELDGVEPGRWQDDPVVPAREVAAPIREPSSGAYRVREGDWRERRGLSRKRKSVPPSRTREGRRAAHIAKKAERLGMSLADAERMTQRRQTARR